MHPGGLQAAQQSDPGGGDEVATRAIRFAQKAGTPLTPAVYEVWYTYAARGNKAINETLDLAMNTGQAISVDYLTGLYHDHISPRSMGDDMDQISAGLIGTLGSVSSAMDENIQHNSMFSGTLRNVKRSLVQGTSKQELSDIIKKLHVANQEHLSAAQKLGVQLEKSRSHVSKLKGDLIEARRLSNMDYLTGLPNRRMLDETLDNAIFEARQKKTDLSILVGVIDNLQAIGDKWGLSTADNIMKVFAEQLAKALKPGQFAARFEGAKFAIVLPDGTNRDGFAVAEFARKRFKTLDWVSKESGEVIGAMSVSFGGAMLRVGDTRASLIDRADANMKQAQREGMDRSVIS